MFSIIKRIIKLSGDKKGKIKLGFFLSFLESILDKIPILMFLYALIKLISNSFTLKDFYIVLATVILSVIVSVIFRYKKEKNVEGIGYPMFAEQRYKLGDHLKRLPMSFFTESNVGNMTSVITTDIKWAEEMGMREISAIAASFIGLVISLLMLSFFSIPIALITAVSYILFAIVFAWWQKIAKRNSKDMQESQKEVSTKTVEYIRGMEVVKSFNLVGDKQDKLNDKFKNLTNIQLKFEKNFILPSIFINSIVALSIAAITYVSGILAIEGSMIIPFAIMLIVFSFEMYAPLIVLVNKSSLVRILESSLNRFEAAMKEKELDDNGKDVTLDNFNISVENISFSYGDNQVIHNLSFEAKEKSMTALVGKSGCGKSTLVNLIARFWDVDSGKIKIGGVDIRDMAYSTLASNISMVFQKVYLFNDTIYNNIAFGNPNATKEMVIEASKKARCYDFINELENGFDTVVAEGGVTLSGGEKQRISIARAILKDAPIVLLDEATASIDPDNETFIQEAINNLIENKTLIVIAHKLSTIKNSNNIVVIDEGVIVEEGEHSQLLENKGLYEKLWTKRQKSNKWKIKK